MEESRAGGGVAGTGRELNWCGGCSPRDTTREKSSGGSDGCARSGTDPGVTHAHTHVREREREVQTDTNK